MRYAIIIFALHELQLNLYKEEDVKKKVLLVVVSFMLVSLLLAGCGPKVKTWDDIVEAGKIVVGTSPDYPPFEFIDENGGYAGFDVELMQAIADKLGVELVWEQMPFDSLIAAIQTSKIDASIAAFNYDEERDANVDFTSAYYEAADAFLVREDFTGTIAAPEDAANYKIGVQSGTVQLDWVQSTLVDSGLMPAENMISYERFDVAALDLQAGRIDVIMGDDVVIKSLMQAINGFMIAYEAEVSSGPMHIIIPEGATTIADAINVAIEELQAEGFVDALILEYFGD